MPRSSVPVGQSDRHGKSCFAKISFLRLGVEEGHLRHFLIRILKLNILVMIWPPLVETKEKTGPLFRVRGTQPLVVTRPPFRDTSLVKFANFKRHAGRGLTLGLWEPTSRGMASETCCDPP